MRGFTRCSALLTIASSPLLAAGAAPPAELPPHTIRLDGHRAVRVFTQTTRETRTVLALTDDVLTCGAIPATGALDVRFTPDQYTAFLETGIAHEVLIDDIQAHYDQWWSANEAVRRQEAAAHAAGVDGPGWYEAFRDLEEIESRLEQLATAHPTLATLSIIGESVEGRPIRMLRITGPGPTEGRPAMVIQGNQHARESLTPMVTMYFAEQLLVRYTTHPQIQKIVDELDFHIIPTVNPDGYVYDRTVSSWWRKNRSLATPNCPGVDLNRNWGHQWGLNSGSSGSPCTETYRGPARFSEPETRAVARVLDRLGREGRLRAHMDIHSVAQKFLSPWGYTTVPPRHLPLMNALGLLMRDSLATLRGTQYTYGAGSVILYPVSGGSRDYSYGNFGAMSWTMELSGPGFYPPPTEIIPVGEEVILTLSALAGAYLPAPGSTGLGACCITSGCHITGEEACTALAGTFHGAGSTCATTVCPLQYQTTMSMSTSPLGQGAGVFLDITAADRDIRVIAIDYAAGATAGSPVQLDVHTRPGSYAEAHGDPAGWVLLESFAGTSAGTAFTSIPLSTPLDIPAGQTTAIYLIGNIGGIRVLENAASQAHWWGRNLTIDSHLVRTAPWSGTTMSPRTFSGAILYTLNDEPCYANCDSSTIHPILNVDDFTCFINRFAEGLALPPAEQVDHWANCDQSVTTPALNIDDFTCFINAFAAACP